MLLDIWAELSVYSIPEIIAVLASLTYVILAPVSIAVAGSPESLAPAFMSSYSFNTNSTWIQHSIYFMW